MPQLNYPLIISLIKKVDSTFVFFFNLWIQPNSNLGGQFYVEVAFLCRFALRSQYSIKFSTNCLCCW